jgi:hypothetical protein
MRRSANALAISIVVAGSVCLTACGDPIQADRSFITSSIELRVVEPVGGSVQPTGVLVSGALVGAQRRPALNTLFREQCSPERTDSGRTLYRCLALLNTGPKVYVAAGVVDSPYSTLTSLDKDGTTATMTITRGPRVPPTGGPTTPGAGPASPPAYLVTVTLRTG